MNHHDELQRRLDLDDPPEQEEVDIINDLEREQRSSHALPRRRRVMLWVLFVAIIAIGVWFYLRYCSPYVSDACMTGYVTSVEKRGMIFKTFEGQMISEQAVTDTTHLYSRDVNFSIPSDSLARRLQDLQGSGQKVRVYYSLYSGILPWRGASKMVITGIAPK